VDQESKEIKDEHGEGNASFYVRCTRTYPFHLLYRQLGVRKLSVTHHPPHLCTHTESSISITIRGHEMYRN